MKKKSISEIRRTHLGRLVFELNRYYKRVSVDYIRKNGFPELSHGILSTLSQIDIEAPVEMQELIIRLNSTKQAVSRTLKPCEDLGFIKREPHPKDGRALMIRFLPKGLKLMSVAAEAIQYTESSISEKVGKDRFKQMKTLLAEVNDELDLVKVDETSKAISNQNLANKMERRT